MFGLIKEKQARLFLAGYAVSVFGTGFVYPLTAIYLDSVVMATTNEISLYLFLVGACSFLAAPLSGVLSDRIGCQSMGIVGIMLQAFGSLIISISPAFHFAIIGGMVLGVGNGCFYGAQTPLLYAIFGKERLTKLFGMQYIVMNVAVAISGVAGGVVASQFGAAGFRMCYLFNSFSFLVYGATLLLCLHRVADSQKAELVDGLGGTSCLDGNEGILQVVRSPFFMRVLLPLALIQFLFAGFGFSQMDSVMPLVFVNYGAFDVSVAGLFLSINCVAVVAFQAKATSYIEEKGRQRALTIVAVIWLLATLFSVVAVTIFPGSLMGVVLIGVYAIVFGVGETFVSPSIQPLIVENAPKSYLGSFSAAINTMYSLGAMVGPAMTVGLLTPDDCSGVWLAIFPALIAGGLFAAFLLRDLKNARAS